ncbi:MAG: ABC transporter permease [Clostridium sp.]|jgi:putative ABC transport system permease protein|nr:ABC transporter permease [Clostridium sp.]MCH3963521.1 ABC transporter permease [Clostridium sp.]MCI1714662.1 ABC transporter permease [Clostridium sp.]MCI1799149.1 ABC transporter permease [Clostridium sp.]MCI1812845.1 ABC transporter permease [Clostridium sp.]MCI1869735.1 ABC transporter permease [Clostridium sp.]
MKFGDGFGLALQGLKRRKGRTLLTSLAVAIGTMLVVTMVSIGTSGENLVLKQIDDSHLKSVEVYNYKYFDQYNEDLADIDINDMFRKIDNNTVEKLKNIKGIEKLTAVLNQSISSINVNGKIKKDETILTASNDNTVVYDNTKKGSRPIIAGRNLNKSDKNSVVVGQKYLDSMGIKNYKSVIGKNMTIIENQTENENIKLKPLKLNAKIVGVLNEKFETKNTIWASIDAVSKVKSYYSLQNNYIDRQGYDSVIIYARSVDDVKYIGDKIKRMDYFYMSYQDVVEKIKSSFKMIEAILSILGMVVLLVASVGIVNTMIMVIYERTKSIGIMKSLGASRKDIHGVFIIQSGMIGFVGGIMGIIFSMLNLKIIQFGLKMFLENKKINETINFNMPISLAFGTLSFSIVVSIIAGIYPSRKASKMDPVKALNS